MKWTSLDILIKFVALKAQTQIELIAITFIEMDHTREYLRGKNHCTVDLLFDWFGLACLANKNKNYNLAYS